MGGTVNGEVSEKITCNSTKLPKRRYWDNYLQLNMQVQTYTLGRHERKW